MRCNREVQCYWSFFSEIIFWSKYLCFLDTPICVFFKFRSIFGNILFLTQYYNGNEGKNLHFRYTNHITRTSQVWQAIWGADLFSTNGLRIIIFHKKCYFTHFWPYITTRKKNLDFSYTTHITRTSRVWQAIWGTDLLVKKSRKWPQDHYFSQKVLFYPFLTKYWYYNGKERKNLYFRYTTHIKRTLLLWRAIRVYIFLVKKSEKWPQDYYFS